MGKYGKLKDLKKPDPELLSKLRGNKNCILLFAALPLEDYLLCIKMHTTYI